MIISLETLEKGKIHQKDVKPTPNGVIEKNKFVEQPPKYIKE